MYQITLEVRGEQGKEEVMEALRGLSDGRMEGQPQRIGRKVLVRTVVDGIKIKEEAELLSPHPKRQEKAMEEWKEGKGRERKGWNL